jgi:membrane peptidoglycan carboxypeptidase
MAILKTNTVSGIGTEGTVFEGDITFDSLNYMTLPKGTTTQSNRGRGVIGGGFTPTLVKTVQYIEIQSTGISVDFGDKTDTRYAATAVSSSTRGVMAGGHSSSSSPYPVVNVMDYITIATTSNAIDFGDLLVAAANKTGTCNNTRGVMIGGYNPNTKAMDYITIATTGNAADFGDSIGGFYGMNQGGVVNSPTRGVVAGGNSDSAPTAVNTIQYITIATLGNATDFGDLTHTNGYFNVGACSETRGLFMGGADITSPYAVTNVIDYITIATTGNSADFGDLTVSAYTGQGLSNGSRGVFAGGQNTPTNLNSIQYVTIASTGNAQDFGNLFEIQRQGGGMSDSHGGLT